MGNCFGIHCPWCFLRQKMSPSALVSKSHPICRSHTFPPATPQPFGLFSTERLFRKSAFLRSLHWKDPTALKENTITLEETGIRKKNLQLPQNFFTIYSLPDIYLRMNISKFQNINLNRKEWNSAVCYLPFLILSGELSQVGQNKGQRYFSLEYWAGDVCRGPICFLLHPWEWQHREP